MFRMFTGTSSSVRNEQSTEQVGCSSDNIHQSQEFSRLISAAVVSPGFCQQLLNDPSGALSAGYNGESFHLSAQEYAQILSIEAASLEDFASQLVESEQHDYNQPATVSYQDTLYEFAESGD